MKPLKHLKALCHTIPVDAIKSIVRGQIIRIKNPKKYKQLKKVKPSHRLLKREKRELTGRIKKVLNANGIKPVNVFGRVKSLSSLYRKAKRLQSGEKGFRLKSDLLGITIFMKDIRECEQALNVLVENSNPLNAKKLFPGIENAKNPRNFYNEKDLKHRPSTQPKQLRYITLYTAFSGIEHPVHINIMKREDYWLAKRLRGKYLKNLKKQAKKPKK